jgi:hypothetical protein
MFQVGDLVRYGDPVISNDIPGLVMGLVYDTDPEYPDFLEVQWLDWEQGTLADEDPEVLELVSSVSEGK